MTRYEIGKKREKAIKARLAFYRSRSFGHLPQDVIATVVVDMLREEFPDGISQSDAEHQVFIDTSDVFVVYHGLKRDMIPLADIARLAEMILRQQGRLLDGRVRF